MIFDELRCERKLIRRKPIVGLKYMILFNIIFIMLNFIVYRLMFLIKPEVLVMFQEIYINELNNIITIIIALSTISVAIFQIVIQNIDDRIMGISYKGIFFNDMIWKYFNFPKCTFIVLEMIVLSILNYALKIDLNITSSDTFRGIVQVELLLITVLCSYRICYLTSVAVFKKSVVYFNIQNKILKYRENDMIFKVHRNLNMIGPSENKYNTYIYEEISILLYIITNIEKLQEIKKEDIIEKIKEIIKNDTRDLDELKNHMKKLQDKEFENENCIWNQILNEIDAKQKITNKMNLKKVYNCIKNTIKTNGVLYDN